MKCLNLALTLVLASALAGCGDDANDGGGGDAGGQTADTLSAELSASGLGPARYAVDNQGASLCSTTFTYPGSPPVTENQDLAGFESFEILVDDSAETVLARGRYDDLAMRWSDNCLRFEAGTDSVTNHSACEGDDTCTPFSRMELCVGAENNWFFAEVPECGHNTFPLVMQ